MAAATTAGAATFFFLHLLFTLFSFSSADDTAIMSKLLSSFSPTPSGWSPNTHFCQWENVSCDSTKSFVTSINLVSNSLSGTLPSELNQLSRLQSISLQQNSLSGTLPSFANMTSLQEIYLDSNNFESVPQNFLMGLSNLESFTMDDNSKLFPWQIPLYFADSTSLVNFYASNANITGSIPDFFSAFPSFRNLRLSYNNLTGSLPPSFGGSTIQNLWLNNQNLGLSGTLDVLSSMRQLSQVWLHANAFTGSIPDLSNCKSLFDLQLRDNRLTGLVSPSLTNLPKLVNITLQYNKLQGPMPEFGVGVKVNIGDTNSFCKDTPGPCDHQVAALLDVAGAIGYPISLADSWKGNDACNDWNFITCDSQKVNVTGVNFAMQGFSGRISPALGNLSSLRNLNLNNNELSGIIPDVLITLPQLQTFDVTNNNLSGPIPIFAASVKFSHDGNPFTGMNVSDGGSGGSGIGPGPGSGSSDGSPSRDKKGRSVSAGLIIGVVGVLVVVVVVFLLYLSYKCYSRKRLMSSGRIEDSEIGKETTKSSVTNGVNGYGGGMSELQSQSSSDHSEKMPIFKGGNVAISIQVLREVTNNFSDENVLGRGGFGIVYKGEMRDGTKIAVKRMESGAMGTKRMNEFRAEIAVLTKVRHRHLVGLLGYCINGNERLLVYEYMPQGTLSQHLFKWKQNGTRPLTWKERVTIAFDVARGVEYLHCLAQQSFIHRDLKPLNILLGDDMRAKVADFGLVRNVPNGNYSVETRLAGTFGYLAPEYTATGRVTTKVDVYAFGVVLMEIITGRKAVDETVSDEMSHLVAWFRRVLMNKDNLRKAIDSTLEPDDETYESICKVAKLAGHCTGRKPSQRPDMAHVVNVLGALVEQWKPSNHDEEEGNGIDRHMSLPQDLVRWQSDEASWTTFDDFSYRLTHSSIL